jgi:hypothetical protein
MHQPYRGHAIVVLNESPVSAVIFEQLTGTELPTKVTAHPGESEGNFLRRACDLIDVYLDGLEDREAANLTAEPVPALRRKAG